MQHGYELFEKFVAALQLRGASTQRGNELFEKFVATLHRHIMYESMMTHPCELSGVEKRLLGPPSDWPRR